MRKTFIKIGDVYGELTVVKVNVCRTNANKLKSECICFCGNIVVVQNNSLVRGNTQSCGCKAGNHKHGQSKNKNWTKAYGAWHSMMHRCYLPSYIGYSCYGGRGIKVCERWKKFELFFEDMGEAEVGKSLDRINVNGNYEPSNCRWATNKEQGNNRRNNHSISFNGRTQTITQWSDELNICRGTLLRRLKRGWSVDKAFTTPVNTKFQNNKKTHY